MENNFNSPDQVILGNIKTGVVKAERSILQMILLGIMAGAFIALGGATSNVAVHGIADVGLSRALAGAIFPVGLMLIVFVGGELFIARITWLGSSDPDAQAEPVEMQIPRSER